MSLWLHLLHQTPQGIARVSLVATSSAKLPAIHGQVEPNVIAKVTRHGVAHHTHSKRWKPAGNLVGLLLTGSALLWGPIQPDLAFARIPTDAIVTLRKIPRVPTPEDLMGARRPSTRGSQVSADEDITSQVKKIVSLMTEAKEASLTGDYDKAGTLYSKIIKGYPDLAVTEYARVNYALMQYQTGHTSDAILELDDEEVSLRGNPEVHSALAAILYAERPRQRDRSEEQWDLAMSFDKRFADPEWVEKERGWPPKMVAALNKFLALQ